MEHDYCMHELIHKLTNDSRLLSKLGNIGKAQKCTELQPSAQISSPNENFAKLVSQCAILHEI